MDNISKYPHNGREFIEILQHFDPKETLYFYKNIVKKTYFYLYEKQVAKDDYRSELLRKFIEYDISLSPFTSFPVNDPIKLLFKRPFERIYDDIYLIDESDYDILVNRAYFIYLNFAEILISGIASIRRMEEYFSSFLDGAGPEEKQIIGKSLFLRRFVGYALCNREYLNSLIKELIFYWNIASLRLDWLYYELININQISPEMEKYPYLWSWEDPLTDIPIIDIKKDLFHPKITSESMMVTALWSSETDPFTTLRYCNCFKELGLEEKQIKIEDILSKVGKSLNC